MKHALTIILSIICWVGAISAEVFCGVAIVFLLRNVIEFTVSELTVLMMYFPALFILGPIMSVVAFRIHYRHYCPSAKWAKWIVAFAIITFLLCLPTCYFLIAEIFKINSPFTHPFGVLSTLLSIIIPIASVTLCFYVLRHTLPRINESN